MCSYTATNYDNTLKGKIIITQLEDWCQVAATGALQSAFLPKSNTTAPTQDRGKRKGALYMHGMF